MEEAVLLGEFGTERQDDLDATRLDPLEERTLFPDAQHVRDEHSHQAAA